MRPSRPPVPVRAGFAARIGHLRRLQPAPQGLGAQGDPLALGQLLARERRPKIGIAGLEQLEHPGLDSFQGYATRYGLPQALYTDHHSTYRGKGAPTVADELAGRERPQSQFERAVAELGVTILHAHSPQAKGRVERLFRTFQDRVIKEWRLARIRTIPAANAFLETYLPRYNQRFRVAPAAAADLHRPCPGPTVLAQALCRKTPRTVQPDGTVVCDRQWFQVDEPHYPKRVVLEEHLDGSRHLTVEGRRLRYHRLPARPARTAAPRRPPTPRGCRRLPRRIIPGSGGPFS